MNKTNMPTPFEWGEVQLSETVLIDDVPYPTRRAIGECLKYEFPQQAIAKILERNPHIEEHSVVVNLTSTDGKKYETNVYHPIGLLLIVMESGQPAAHRLKRAIAEFVWHFAGPQTRETTEATAREKLRDVRLRNAGHVISMIARADRIKEPRIRHRALRFVDVALGGSMGIPEQFELFQKERWHGLQSASG